MPETGRVVVLRALTLATFALLLIAERPAQAQTGTVVHSFTGHPDGAAPFGTLVLYGGNFYGTTQYGGSDAGNGYGTIFELSPDGGGGWNEAVLYRFTGQWDGAYPSDVIVDNQGNLYGTTEFYGVGEYGVVFELSPGAGGWTYTVLYDFTDNGDGAYPSSGLVMDSSRNLYGGTATGGKQGNGIVFELSPSGGVWNEQVIYDDSEANGLTMSEEGNLFCVSDKNVFELSPSGKGGWNWTFVANLAGITSNVVFDQAGHLYGATITGGSTNQGTIYELIPGKHGQWSAKTLYSFKGYPKDGAGPMGVLLDSDGNIYGSTQAGGPFIGGVGTVFELVPPVGTGKYTEKILWDFNGTDGDKPDGGLVFDAAGNLYGTTYKGGAGGHDAPGTVFEVTP